MNMVAGGFEWIEALGRATRLKAQKFFSRKQKRPQGTWGEGGLEKGEVV